MKQIVKTDVLQCQKFMIINYEELFSWVSEHMQWSRCVIGRRTWTAWCGWEIGSKVGQIYNYVGVQKISFIKSSLSLSYKKNCFIYHWFGMVPSVDNTWLLYTEANL